MYRVVGIGDYIISHDERDILRTYSLATCVAVTLYSPIKKVLAMVHIALPSSTINAKSGIDRPGYFADTAIPLLVDTMFCRYKCEPCELVVHLFGGAQSINSNDIFQIGSKNIAAIEKLLTSYNFSFDDGETGGIYSRTIEMDVATGTPKVTYHPLWIQDIGTGEAPIL